MTRGSTPTTARGVSHRRAPPGDHGRRRRPPAAGQRGRRLWAAFNGEIYNHRELRARICARRGHRLLDAHATPRCSSISTRSTARRLVHALEGMFAFAVWDERARAAAAGARPLRREAAVPGRARRRAAVRLRADVAARRASGAARARPRGDRRLLRVRLRARARHDRAGRSPAAAGAPAELGVARRRLPMSALVVAAEPSRCDGATRFPDRGRGERSCSSSSVRRAPGRRRAAGRVPQRRRRLDAGRGRRRAGVLGAR